MSGYEWKTPKSLTMGAVLVSIAVIIQASPLYLPVVGVSLSALSTLPVALASYYNGMTGLLTYLAASILLLFWNVPQAVIFLLTSGLLGIMLGTLIRWRLRLISVVAIPAIALSAGVFLAGGLLGIPVFPWLPGLEKVFFLPVMVFFCAVYASIWVPLLAVIISRMKVYLEE